MLALADDGWVLRPMGDVAPRTLGPLEGGRDGRSEPGALGLLAASDSLSLALTLLSVVLTDSVSESSS